MRTAHSYGTTISKEYLKTAWSELGFVSSACLEEKKSELRYACCSLSSPLKMTQQQFDGSDGFCTKKNSRLSECCGTLASGFKNACDQLHMWQRWVSVFL
jgi:hypothetical protein